MSSSSAVPTAVKAIQTDSVFELALQIAQSETLNMIRFPGGYEAENAGAAFTAKALGESGRGKGQGVGNNVSGKLTGLSYNDGGPKGTVFLTIMDKTHRQDSKQGNGSDAGMRKFEFATRTLVDITDKSRRLEYVEVCDNFGKWRRISLAHLPAFPSLPVSSEEDFSTELISILGLGRKIEKLNSKITGIKSKARKKNLEKVTASDGTVAQYNAPTGESFAIVDVATGEKVPGVPRQVKNRVRLYVDLSNSDADYFPAEWIQVGGKYDGNLKSDLEMLPVYMAELEDNREEYVSRYAQIRPFEARFIEDHLFENGEPMEEFLTIGGKVFEMQINEDTEYDRPSDEAEKIKNGEYEQRSFQSSRGSWEVIRIKEEVTA
jgi:hypothetical protein